MPSTLPTLEPSVSMSPSANPSSSPSCYAGANSGRITNVNPTDCPLHECAGNCKTTSNCREGLTCLIRDENTDRRVPGCGGFAYEDNNYCIKVRDLTIS